MANSAKRLPETPSQTAGPYVHIGLTPELAGLDHGPRGLGQKIFPDGTSGQPITIEGHVFDGSGTPVKDMLIEVWQADSKGRYAAQGCDGWGRVTSDLQTGRYEINTIKPGPVDNTSGTLAPHVNLWLVARGINIGLNTRLYFEDEAIANADDSVFMSVIPRGRRDTLLARTTENGYRFDIYLQGDAETVFFDV